MSGATRIASLLAARGAIIVRLSFVLVIFLCLYATAQATTFVWNNYSQWARLTPDQQGAYLAGAWDSYANIVSSDASQHYTKCMHDSGMKLGQFRDRVAAYAKIHPNLQVGDMQSVMIGYLIELCGEPPRQRCVTPNGNITFCH